MNDIKHLIEGAQWLNRASKFPGDCKATVFERRVELAAILLGCVGHEDKLALAVCEIQNPQPRVKYIEDEEDDDYGF